MAGKKCPKCGENNFFETPQGGECTNCNYKGKLPPNSGKGGKGTKCAFCKTQTVFNGKCTRCGAKFSETN